MDNDDPNRAAEEAALYDEFEMGPPEAMKYMIEQRKKFFLLGVEWANEKWEDRVKSIREAFYGIQ